jgi:drug/metabolite transporter (DMT)-like permease
MKIHITTGHWRLGFVLSLLTAFLWGVLPIALKGLLEEMDAFTITWYRFFIAALVLAVFVIRKKGLPPVRSLKGPVLLLLITASVGLSGNYILYVLGLDYLSPGTATVVIQLAPMFLLFGSLVVYREHFSFSQWMGFAILLFGLSLFFNDRFDELLSTLGTYTTGVLLIIASAVIWAIYALSQKQLLNTFPSETIMLFIYVAGIVFFLPIAYPASILQLDSLHLFLLLFCALNTLVAYGSFAEALDHWEASRVSMVLATIPLITLLGMKVCSTFFPWYIDPERLNLLSILGACLVVAGSILSAFGRADTRETP